MGAASGSGGWVVTKPGERRRTTTTRMRALGVAESPDRAQPHNARTFLLAVGARWVLAALIAPVVRGGVSTVAAIELRLLGVAALAIAWLALRGRAGAPVAVRRTWAVIAAAGGALIGLDAAAIGGGTHDVTPLFVAIALVATAPPPWRIGAPIAAGWLAIHVVVAIAASGSPRGPLALAALEGGALALVVAAGHRSWRLHHDLYESRRLGHFRLLSPIGRGMSEVWLAWDEQRRREVALKLLRQPGAAKETRARFAREAACVRLLRSPRTVRIYDYGVTDDGFAYMALEYLRGLDLDALVHAYGPLEPLRAHHVALEAARGLALAHARGIVHRDVKPANLHCADSAGSEDFVRILDFGVARGLVDRAITLDGLVVGTPAFMPPEAFSGGDVDPAADVYALGATIYFALTGQPPFDGESVADLREAHRHAPVVPPSLRAPAADLPRAFEDVVLRCLAKEPVDRYADAAELAAALEACAASLGPAWTREAAARWWHHARTGRVVPVPERADRTTEVEAVPISRVSS